MLGREEKRVSGRDSRVPRGPEIGPALGFEEQRVIEGRKDQARAKDRARWGVLCAPHN